MSITVIKSFIKNEFIQMNDIKVFLTNDTEQLVPFMVGEISEHIANIYCFLAGQQSRLCCNFGSFIVAFDFALMLRLKKISRRSIISCFLQIYIILWILSAVTSTRTILENNTRVLNDSKNVIG